MRMKRDLYAWKILVGFLVFLASLLGIIFWQSGSNFDFLNFLGFENRAEVGKLEVEVEEVIDGDTIWVKDIKSQESFRVRYLGIDTPELEGPDYESCFGDQAKEKNEDLTLDQKLILEFDRDKYDQFGRTLAYVYTLDDFGEKDIFINLELLQQGYARFYLDKQNTLWQDELIQAVLNAQEDSLGLWGTCGEDDFNGECLIKGNIDRLGEKHYHLPGDKYYDETVVNFDKEDQWLCTIEEAEAGNFQRALE